jgi:hypothetical protein
MLGVLADKDLRPERFGWPRGGGHFQAALDLYHVTAFGGQDAPRVGIEVEFLVGRYLDFIARPLLSIRRTTLRDTVTQPVALLHSVDWRLLRRYTSVGK